MSIDNAFSFQIMTPTLAKMCFLMPKMVKKLDFLSTFLMCQMKRGGGVRKNSGFAIRGGVKIKEKGSAT